MSRLLRTFHRGKLSNTPIVLHLYAVSHASFKTSNLDQANKNRLRIQQVGQNDRVFLFLLSNTVSQSNPDTAGEVFRKWSANYLVMLHLMLMFILLYKRRVLLILSVQLCQKFVFSKARVQLPLFHLNCGNGKVPQQSPQILVHIVGLPIVFTLCTSVKVLMLVLK